MPQIHASTPRETREFAGLPISTPHPYAPGHVLTAPESAFMNVYVGSAVGNRFGAALKSAVSAVNKARTEAWANRETVPYTGPVFPDESGPALATEQDALAEADYETFQEWFEALYTDFEPGVYKRAPNGTGTSVKSDPIISLARSFAEMDLIAKIEAKFGKGGVAKFRAVKMDDKRTKFTHLLDQQFEKAKTEYLDRARAQFEESSDNAAEADDDLDLTL